MKLSDLEVIFEDAWDAAFEAEFSAGGFQEDANTFQRFDGDDLEMAFDEILDDNVQAAVIGASDQQGEVHDGCISEGLQAAEPGRVSPAGSPEGSGNGAAPDDQRSAENARAEPGTHKPGTGGDVGCEGDHGVILGCNADGQGEGGLTEQLAAGTAGAIAPSPDYERMDFRLIPTGPFGAVAGKVAGATRQDLVGADLSPASGQAPATDFCNCQIEMASFRDPGNSCLHCSRPIRGAA